MSEQANNYNILITSLSDYLKHHWERTAKARKKVQLSEMEWHLIWSKNYWQERCEALEKEL